RLLAPEQGFVLAANADDARRTARNWMGYFLAAENYWNNLLRMGFKEEDRREGGTDRLVDAVIAWGDADAICERIDEHFSAGADHVVIQALGTDPLGDLRALAPSLIG